MKKLQDFTFNKSQYERPTQKKICGWSIYGKPCQIGPNEKGACRAEFECEPYKRNDRWHCTRPASSGGKCDSGASCQGVCSNRIPKCVPLNSIRNKRGKVVLWASMMSVALILIFLFGPLQNVFLSPGDLSSKHSFDNQKCNDCHTISQTNLSSLVKNAFASLSVKNESNKCQACHKLGQYASNPHNLDYRSLDDITSRINKTSGDSLQTIPTFFTPAGYSKTGDTDNIMACVSCHSEHKGKDFDLKLMSNAQCTVCHVNQFTGFDESHPEFKHYPYKRRTGIIFDHNAHINDYFQKEKFIKRSPQGCNNCHFVSVTGMYMDVFSFEKNCVACHSKDVTGEKLEVRGIPIFNLPGIDVISLKSKGFNIGQWPNNLEDQELSSFMIYLLSADPQIQPLLAQLLNGDIDLTDLSGINRTTSKQISALIWGIKEIIYDLSNEGHSSVKKRLEQLTQTKLTPALLKSLTGLLPEDVISNAQKSWLPNLKAEMKRFRSGKIIKTRLVKTKDISGITNKEIDDWTKEGGWYRQQYTIYYRPQGHQDKFLHQWLELTKLPVMTQNNSKMEQGNLFQQLANKKNPGQCIKCHSVEESVVVDTGSNNSVVDNENIEVRINWKAGLYDESYQKFSKFDHSAHFSMLGETGCKTCHKLDKEAKYIDSYQQQLVSVFNSNFKPIEKATCQTCHSHSKIGDNCLACHNYHIGQLHAAMPASKL